MSNTLYPRHVPAWSVGLNPLALLSVISSLFLVTTFAAGQSKQDGSTSDPNVVAGQHVESILNRSAIWKPLLHGEGLKGWTGDLKGYTVSDGVLICKKGGKNLVSKSEYSDFAFQFEFKLEESGNNGIGIRVPAGGHPASSGMEIQILDHNGARYSGMAEMADGKQRKLSWLKPWQYHGSIYGITPAKTGYLKPVGEWNQETIIAIDDHVIVILNGAVIVDAFLDDTVPVDGGK
ncbi:MAG: DUF1080 domain-containing protein, partial [Rubripirellula sp.]|nr:DUF1080 domain-containing protein [Rubripirellula sp.]